jgi:hypothetical protein
MFKAHGMGVSNQNFAKVLYLGSIRHLKFKDNQMNVFNMCNEVMTWNRRGILPLKYDQ